MQRRTMAALSLVLLAATALAGCTSGDDEPDTSSGAAPTTEGAAPADPDWFCRLIESESVDAATDGRADVAREVEVLATADEYQCDVLVPTDDGGSEVAMSLSMHRNIPGLADERLAEVQAIEGNTAGPEHLGVSYFADTLGVSVVPCKAEANGAEDDAEVPYVFVIRAPLDTDGATTASLFEPLTRMVKEMDQGYGCSPSKIHPIDQGQQTQAPGDDAETTTAP
ncbi:hypothetical protein [Ornithinimicrobium faecis]|uniref:hypothetical protein n=1 Tax=Ornithinimicrobium faecis TaxID=2934158 RepID=UPI00211926A0|nr:hypothetical protein [Ornithinimicrobium sp. HY1745]